MTYAGSFHRLVMIGDLYADIFNTTMTIIPTTGGSLPAVSDALLEDVADVVGDWWPNIISTTPSGLSFSTHSVLTSIKLNRINASGHYQDSTAKEHIYPTPIPGINGGNFPPQLTVVASLRGAAPRALAGKGRMFFPLNAPTFSGLGTDGRLTSATATGYATAVKDLIMSIAGVYTSNGVSGVVGIASKVGGGAFQAADIVTVGRTVDTMRSRRNKLPEEFVSVDIT